MVETIVSIVVGLVIFKLLTGVISKLFSFAICATIVIGVLVYTGVIVI